MSKAPTKADVIKGIKVLLGMETATPPAPEGDKPKFSELALEDGTILMVEGEMVAGVPIMVKTETGTEAAKPGEYKLTDGSTLVVDQEGKLVEVKAAEVMAVENPEVNALKERVTALENSLKTANDTANAATAAATTATEQMKKTEEASKQLLKLMEEFIATPQTNTEKPTTTVETPEDKFAAKFKAIKNLSIV